MSSLVVFEKWFSSDILSLNNVYAKSETCLYGQRSNARSLSWDWSDRPSWATNTDFICHLSPNNVVYLITNSFISFIDLGLLLVPAEILAWHWFSHPRSSLFITQYMSSGHIQVTMVAQHFWSLYSLGCKLLILLCIKSPTEIVVAENKSKSIKIL